MEPLHIEMRVYMVHHNDVALRSFYMAQGYFQAKRNSATTQSQQ